MSSGGQRRPPLARHRLALAAASTRPTSWPASPPTCSRRRAARRSSYLPAEGLYALREQLAARGRDDGFAEDPDEIIVTSGAKQGDQPHRARDARAGRRGDRRVADLRRPAGLAAPDRRARDRRAGGRGRLRRRAARAPARAPRGEAGGAPDAPARTRPAATSPRSAARGSPSSRSSATSSCSRTASTPTRSFDREPTRPLRELAPAHVIYVNSLSKVVGGGLRAGWVAARGPVRERIAMLKLESDFSPPTLIQHIAARWLATGAYDRHVEHTQPVLPRAPRRAAGGARAPHARRVPGRPPRGRPPRLGHAQAPARRARALRRGRAPRRGVHAGRRRSRPSAARRRRSGSRSRCSTRTSWTRA